VTFEPTEAGEEAFVILQEHFGIDRHLFCDMLGEQVLWQKRNAAGDGKKEKWGIDVSCM